MPSSRRLKYLLTLVALVFVVTLYYSSDSSHTQDAEFYKKTKLALEKATEDKRLKAEADTQLEKILKNAKDLASGEKIAQVLKTSALPNTVPPGEEQKKAPPAPPGTDEEVDEVSVAGRKMMPKPKPWVVDKDEEVALNGGRLKKIEEPGLAEAKTELNIMLKKSPSTFTLSMSARQWASLIHNNLVLIFSKSTCPYSRRAKTLLLDTYKIVPAPYVVELDLLDKPISDANDPSPPTLGRKLQDFLAESTGRKTVPNILINGLSIGGSDELAKLDADDELIKKIRDMGGRWVYEVERRGGPTTVPKGRGM
jgi:glutaredoxin